MRAAAVLLILALTALPVLAADCFSGGGTFTYAVSGPEVRSNLWQFATVRGWPATASGTAYTSTHNHARLAYDGSAFGVGDNACQYGLGSPDGSTLVIVAEYVSDANAVDQRAFFAANSFVIPADADPDPGDVTMGEVPQATAVNDAGTVTVTWSGVPAQDPVIGYRVVVSADGIAGWSTVQDVDTATFEVVDTPGAGAWYYAVQIRYLGSPTQQVSPHGLSDSVTVS